MESGPVTLKKGETLLVDFGQNFAGWECFTVSGKAGTVLSVRHGEILNDQNGEHSRGNDGPGGSIYNANYRSAKATTTYIFSGKGEETYHPSYTFYGVIKAASAFTDTTWTYTFTLPANTTGTLTIPANAADITVNGKAASELTAADGITVSTSADGSTVFLVVCGSFTVVTNLK